MAFSSGNIDEAVTNYGGMGGLGYGGGSGAWAMIILIVVVLWVLFSKDGHGHDGGHAPGYGYGYGGGCGPCVQPTYKDESNWEQESHLKDKLCCIEKEVLKTDSDVWKSACETQKEVMCDGQKTRSLIEANYIQDLRDKIAEQNSNIQTMKSEAFTERKFDQLAQAINCTNSNIDKMFCKTDSMIAALSCELPKRPPIYADCKTVAQKDIDSSICNYNNNYPRRGNCDGCNDGLQGFGYAY